MTSIIECEKFDIEHEDLLSISEIKSEPQDIESEMKVEEVECGHIDVKQEILPSAVVASIYTTAEVEDTQQIYDNFLNYENKSQDETKNSEEGKSNVAVVHKLYEIDIEEDRNGILVDHKEEKMTADRVCDNRSFEYVDKNMCPQTTDKHFKFNFPNKSLPNKSDLTTYMSKHISLTSNFHDVSSSKPSLFGRNTNGKRFTCIICRKSFSQKAHLITHTRTHTKEKPFKCEVCNKSFSLRAHLTAHTRTHTKEKPFTCNFCGKSFSQKSTLNTHIRIHTMVKPFTCDICNKSFSMKYHLGAHILTHTNDKFFTCYVCSKSFSKKSNLTTHMRSHTNERPFTCYICNRAFSHKSNLTKHTRIHTN